MLREDVPWWEPQGFGLALVTALVSTLCWGTWSNTAKAAGASKVNFALYYVDFCIGTVITAATFWCVFSGLELGRPGLADASNVWYAAAAGTLFGIANLMLTTGIALGGISVAFPICIGTALVLGTVLTYIVDRRSSPYLLFPGVILALLGVLSNARAYALLQASRKTEGKAAVVEEPTNLNPNLEGDEEIMPEGFSSTDESSDDEPPPPTTARILTICAVGGVLMSCWAPLSAKSMKGDGGLSPYTSFIVFTLSSLVMGVAIVSGQQCRCSVMPRVDGVTSALEYWKLPLRLHLWGLLGGGVWAVGTLANLVSGGPLGFALSYALGQTAPVVAVLWGLLWYKEFTGASKPAMAYIGLMFAFFFAAIGLICAGGA